MSEPAPGTAICSDRDLTLLAPAKESGLKHFFHKLFGKKCCKEDQARNPEKAEEAPAKPETAAAAASSDKAVGAEKEPTENTRNSVREINPHSRPVSLFIQRGMEGDDAPLSASETSDSEESKENEKA